MGENTCTCRYPCEDKRPERKGLCGSCGGKDFENNKDFEKPKKTRVKKT